MDIINLESWLWEAACSIRGPLDAPKYKDDTCRCSSTNGCPMYTRMSKLTVIRLGPGKTRCMKEGSK